MLFGDDPKTSKTEKMIKGIISVSVHCAQMLPSHTERNDRLNSGLVITSNQTAKLSLLTETAQRVAEVVCLTEK